MRRIRIQRPRRPAATLVADILPIDPRDPAIVRAKALGVPRAGSVELDLSRVVDAPGVTHLVYRVVR
jgi:hypothetical protein